MPPYYNDSPQSVVTPLNESSHSSRIKAPPVLASADNKRKPIGTTRKLRLASNVLSVWQRKTLKQKNDNKRCGKNGNNNNKKTSSRVKKKKKIQWNMRQNHTKEFDEELCVLTLSNRQHNTPDDDDSDEELPWYEQDYEELEWWEYPDLDEEDDVTKMVRPYCSSQELKYVEAVEGLVWTAAIKLVNIAQFILHHEKNYKEGGAGPAAPTKKRTSVTKKGADATRRRSSGNISGIPSMFSVGYGLPREVQAEKRRFKKSQVLAKSNSQTKLIAQDDKNKVIAEITKKKTIKRVPTTVSTVSAAPARENNNNNNNPKVVPRRTRKVTRTKPSPHNIQHETPAAWTRSSSTPTTTSPSSAADTTSTTTIAAAASQPKRKHRVGSSLPVSTINPTNRTVAAVAVPPSRRPASNIKVLKLQQASLKEKAERLEAKEAERSDLDDRMEKQRKRLERLRAKQQNTT